MAGSNGAESMKGSKVSGSQIAYVLRQAEDGATLRLIYSRRQDSQVFQLTTAYCQMDVDLSVQIGVSVTD
jgi:hypothetical protein